MLHILVLSIVFLHNAVDGSISCYDDSGKPVDWFIVYKLPQPCHSPPTGGMQYMYQDEHTQGWVQGRSLMNTTKGAVGQTLQQLYTEAVRRQEEETAYVLYNDAPPKTVSSSNKGHTKGAILLDRTQGFWLLHSTPHFPPSLDEKEYAWPHSALHYGQTFLCVTYPYSQFKEIGNQLLFTEPEVYDSRVEGTFAQDLPALLNASKGQHVQKEPWNSSVPLTSLGGKEFVSFAKFRFFSDDLYSGWLAQALASDLYVEFWHRSRGILPSNCSGDFRVYNVEEVAFQDPSKHFPSTSDHSKWCVGTESDPGWACVGDMNRNNAEEQRGGGIICCRDPAVWKAFHSLVQNYTDCDGAGCHSLCGL
ncbi:deoxyribonuclease-2-alpha isoform X1 [Sceloporus undulatus]|uniref:deoxyribonuclease-2-alpha isoform X1 n=2 Tax=Sceloporus undulatus TaxID=8520 RepID=UPI001C4BD358|nr:deoxyribonuclease-2-alpha isoform X1 [Sceloporus undulatus]XP_042303736.1 deoxyribonuclease-2-alpha isoform X1 [Sceloporus undulatus]XP_042303737.1 deoxyribonuclease-2-alpha isoform X1 [Sceloporus undulatus]XP_042303738.1 deoxyribonuclease-2-alpha isoform X1 [Sceloporus undulatus]XP_042303739.1 deoxyribonuclease-2-alpha isoform X1 [Sceloporus undulatus]XP_042303740.1 deoxyribonuclease-2-alpha isoform X1 [Sceloporus undulatus]XP_042303742.1 deoxyribonuclease-2-alpha isoform X1 [Sceloporus u